MQESEVTFERIEGNTPEEKAADYANRVNKAYATDESRYSKQFQEILPWMVQDYFTVTIDGVIFLGILRGIGRHSTKEEFMPKTETEDGDD